MDKHTIYKNEQSKTALQSHYDAYIDAWNVDFERTYVDTRFGKTHVLQAGPKDSKPLFILQGGNCISPMSLSWFSSLLTEYRVYAPDTVGHPGYSAETRVSAQDESLALWMKDIMDGLHIEKSAFIGPSYGAGIILRLASYAPDKIACSVLVSPSGILLGSKLNMIAKILFPMLGFHLFSSRKSLQKITDAMSMGEMKEIDRNIIGDIFKHVKLERNMPKLTEREELFRYSSPTLVIAGQRDVFFPGDQVIQQAKEIIPNLISGNLYDMGHFPSQEKLEQINQDIKHFLEKYYE